MSETKHRVTVKERGLSRQPAGGGESSAAGALLSRLRTRAFHLTFLFTRPMTLGVRAAAFDRDGRIFLVRHTYVAGWQLPGGGVEHGETAGEALAKELREEGNIVLTRSPALFAAYLNRAASPRDHVLLYRCDHVSQSAPKRPDREIAEAGFFALDALPAETTPATHRRLAELAGKPPAAHW